MVHQAGLRVAGDKRATSGDACVRTEEGIRADTSGIHGERLGIWRSRQRCGVVLDADARNRLCTLLPQADAGDRPAVDGSANEPVAVEEVRFAIDVRGVEDDWPVQVAPAIVGCDVEWVIVILRGKRLRPGQTRVDGNRARPLD